MKLTAVIPTVNGREALLEQTIQSLADTCDVEVELVVVENSPTIGQAWNEGVEAATGTHLWLGADDVTLLPGWLEAATEAVEAGGYPSPRIVRPDGSIEACGTLGQGATLQAEMQDGLPCHSSPFPFMRREDWDAIGPALSIHYYCDDYLGFKARVHGLNVHVCRGYSLIHHEGVVGRARMVARAMADRDQFLLAVTKEHEWDQRLTTAMNTVVGSSPSRLS